MLMQLCTSIEGPDKASCLQTEWRSAPVLLLCSCPFEVSFSFFFFCHFFRFYGWWVSLGALCMLELLLRTASRSLGSSLPLPSLPWCRDSITPAPGLPAIRSSQGKSWAWSIDQAQEGWNRRSGPMSFWRHRGMFGASTPQAMIYTRSLKAKPKR